MASSTKSTKAKRRHRDAKKGRARAKKIRLLLKKLDSQGKRFVD